MALPQILQHLQANSPNGLGQLKNAIGMIKAAKDPQAMIQQMMSQNSPGMQQAMQYVQEHGGDPKAAFEALSKEKGIDPEEIKKMLQGLI